MFSNRRELAIKKRVKTINGFTIIKYFYEAVLFGIKQRFYEIKNLESDILVGYNFLKKANIILNFENGTLQCGQHWEKFLCFGSDESVIEENKENTSNETEGNILYKITNENDLNDDLKLQRLRQKTIECVSKIHSNINLNLPFRTDIKAEIRTIADAPIWSKQYPYPLSANSFVNSEIRKLLRDNIIRESKSPFNSPIWVVSKKGTNDDGTQKLRMVIDYKKLNEQTVSDKYPIPDCNVILSNLGKSKFFSTIDLESGFYQILMKNEDIEKTAFSVNNGKYEFLRMPFGLKNGPSIFQRAMDNILREFIGKICHVYIDDIVVFSETLEDHSKHLNLIINKLKESNMKISLEKSKFYEKEVEFLGYVIAYGVIKTDPKKIDAIANYPLPQTLRQLRSFLGIVGYYRKFIKNYASIAKPLTKHLSGENGKVSQYLSKKTEIHLDEEGIAAFQRLKNLLTQQVELTQPDFTKKFVLTTDASDTAIGAVLSQEGKPITFISKTLNSTETNYATNEKELYAIVWSLKCLRNYLYGVSNLEIHTDHQPLTFAVSMKNPNAKIKRWRSFIEEFSPKMIYKPGTANVVADAFSRQWVNNLTDNDSMTETQHSVESSDNFTILETRKPLNEFKQQLVLEKNTFTNHESLTTFGRVRHIIEFDSRENLLKILKEFLRPNIVTGIYCTAEDLYDFKETVKNFLNIKFFHTSSFPLDITNKDDQQAIITQTHTRAHRSYKENHLQVCKQYYWPNMLSDFKQCVRNCDICIKNKYNRHPQATQIGAAPIPKKEGEFLNIDIFYAQSLIFMTCVDAYSKFLVIKHTPDKSDLGGKVLELLQTFPNAKKITVDNEPGFTTPQFKSLIQRQQIEIYYCTPRHSITNGQIERAHSTLVEIARCIKSEYSLVDEVECFYKAAKKYNETIHSVTEHKPFEILFNKVDHINVPSKLKTAQEKMLKRNKPNGIRNYQEGDIIYEKIIGQRNKLQPRFRKQKVKEDLGNKVRIYNRNRLVHKNNIRT